MNRFSALRALPERDRAGVLERDAAAGEILRESAPGSEVQLLGFLQLREIAVQARAFGKQSEDAPLIEHIDVILPDHVIDGREPLPVADQSGREARDAVFHKARAHALVRAVSRLRATHLPVARRRRHMRGNVRSVTSRDREREPGAVDGMFESSHVRRGAARLGTPPAPILPRPCASAFSRLNRMLSTRPPRVVNA